LGRPALRAYRGVRVAAGLVLALVTAWVVSLLTLKALPSFDPWLWSLQIAGAVIFVGGVLVAAWNLRIVRRERRGWFRTLWAGLLLLAMLLLLYTAWSFGLLAMTVNY
ncbi:MAG TPA: serine hydrolase, partial [Sphingopyxis sp.]|nr:serine hydrolase [Sphingopyxis sp.]